MSPEERLQHQREYEKTRGKSPERKEKRRGYIQAKRQEAKSLGLCVTCWAPTIPDQTRCKPCAEEHQKYHKEAKERAIQQRIQASGQATDQGAMSELDRAGADRVMLEARLAAISVRDGDGHLQDLALTIRQAGLGQGEANRLLIRAWEAAVEGTLEDGLLSLDEENALAKYADHFSLTQQDLDRNGAQTAEDGGVGPGRHPGHHPPAAAGERQRPLQPDEIRETRLGDPGS